MLEGTFKQSEFAADISQVHASNAEPEYQPALPQPGMQPQAPRACVFAKPVATPVVAQNPTRFWGVVELDADSATMDFSKMTAEVIQHFSVQYGVTVKITVEIEASSSNGLDVSVQRTVKENCGVWKFRLADLESH